MTPLLATSTLFNTRTFVTRISFSRISRIPVLSDARIVSPSHCQLESRKARPHRSLNFKSPPLAASLAVLVDSWHEVSYFPVCVGGSSVQFHTQEGTLAQ
jgi:hypothetical protein